MDVVNSKSFQNGNVYCLRTNDGYPIETTDTFLPQYTKDAINGNTNILRNDDLGSRNERWMIGVSVMSGCPVGCKFCATGTMKKFRNLTYEEIVWQVLFVVNKNPKFNPANSQEFKINYTRMGEPFLNIDNVKKAIEVISELYPNAHHYVSTIGVKKSDYSWVRNNITLQISLHSLIEEKRDCLIPFINKLSIKELGSIRTGSNLKTTLNMTLVDESDFDINILKDNFEPKHFFIKLSPININAVSEMNEMGKGVIIAQNIL